MRGPISGGGADHEEEKGNGAKHDAVASCKIYLCDVARGIVILLDESFVRY